MVIRDLGFEGLIRRRARKPRGPETQWTPLHFPPGGGAVSSDRQAQRKEAPCCKESRGVPVAMEGPHSEKTMEQQDSHEERSPRSPRGNICHLGALQCTHCLITFADSKFQERHMKREHPVDFVAQKLQGVLFICFTCARSFPSSKALIAHQRSHGPVARPALPVAPTTAQPTFPCPDCGKTFGQSTSLRQHHQIPLQLDVAM
ncbi:zinc finger protein 576 isoform X2 [Cynocephalus volans]|uniref:zinc finger protein 576 isoform X2 n=1 Tax=Cynocephalus volans TaxID=110931 RepID=UPI002FCB3F3D